MHSARREASGARRRFGSERKKDEYTTISYANPSKSREGIARAYRRGFQRLPRGVGGVGRRHRKGHQYIAQEGPGGGREEGAARGFRRACGALHSRRRQNRRDRGGELRVRL